MVMQLGGELAALFVLSLLLIDFMVGCSRIAVVEFVDAIPQKNSLL